MTSSQKSRPDINREKIMAAARTIILERGIEALSIRNLATESTLALRTIYNLFGNKENVIISIFEQGTRSIETATIQFQNVLKKRAYKTSDYLDWIEGIEPIFLENKQLIKPSIIAGLSLGYAGAEKINEIHERRIKQICNTLEIAAQRNLIWQDLDLNVCARLAYHNYFNVVLQWARGDIDDKGLIVCGRYALHTISHTLINDPERRENTLDLLRNLKELR